MRIAALCALALIASTAAFADPVTLRTRIEASGPAVTLGDVFEGAGDVAGRAVAPAPSPGQTTTLPTDFLLAAAQSAGLDWVPPAGVAQVRVVRPGGMRATMGPANGGAVVAGVAGATDVAVRRGEMIDLVFQSPGVQLSTRARALGNASVGQSVRLVNLQSNRTIEAVVIGPGAASVSTQ